MGSYANLRFGHFEMGTWKSHITLEVMLLLVVPYLRCTTG